MKEEDDEDEFERYLLGIKWSHGWIEALNAFESENDELGDDVEEQVDVRLKLFLLWEVWHTLVTGLVWLDHWVGVVSIEL